MIDGHLHRCGPDSVGSSVALARAVGGSWVVFPVPGMWACFLFKFACPGLWVFLLSCLYGLCPYVGVWYLFIRCFLFRADAPFPLI